MRPRLVICTTVPSSIAAFLEGQPGFLREHFDVHLVAGPGNERDVARIQRGEGLTPHIVPMTRKITPRTDAQALVELTLHLRRLRPDIVHTYTPKAGIVGMTAAVAAGVPCRIHSVVGMPLMEATGRKARVLAVTERATYTLATDLWSNSTGLRDWMHANLTKKPIRVVGHGSTNGVDATRFDRDRWSDDERNALRAQFDAGPDNRVFLFVGRIVRDKGIHELVDAFTRLHDRDPSVRLVMLGDYERDLDPIRAETERLIHDHPAIFTPGFVDDVCPFMALADVYVLPSYREGMPNSAVEAGSMGLPAIVTDINGCNEVVLHDRTGLLVPAKNADALFNAMERLAHDKKLFERLRAAARPSILERFSQPYFYGELLKAYADAREAAARR
jgi:glycosyltransferase involved in cell wall biosynthesis